VPSLAQRNVVLSVSKEHWGFGALNSIKELVDRATILIDIRRR
jgi:hypothetical protein